MQLRSRALSAGLRLSLLASLGLLPTGCGAVASTGDEGGGGTAGSGVAPPKCTSPVLDAMSGMTRCAEGYSYRSRIVTCDTRATGPLGSGGSGGSAGPSGVEGGTGAAPAPKHLNCASDADCFDIPRGFCQPRRTMFDFSYCAAGCLDDTECATNELCLCGADGGVCISAQCRDETSCEAGYQCATAGPPACSSIMSFACLTREDECVSSESCPQGPVGVFGTGQECRLVGEKRTCVSRPTCGRPFLVEDEPRVARVVVGSTAWTRPGLGSPRVDHLSSGERTELAAHWCRLGQLEHASIAAFARFGLQLLALGAPATLVDATTQAMADESAHTQLCFELASAYAGHSLGPGVLDVRGSLTATDLEEVVDMVIAEGCFGETQAALEALEAAHSERDPVLCAAYAQIAADEQRHAELAFRFVAWALKRGGEAVRGRVIDAVGKRAGVTAGEVVVPCLQALLARAALEERCPAPRSTGTATA